MVNEKLNLSLEDLQLALDQYHLKTLDKPARRLAFLSLSKAFEVAVEYAWKHIRKIALEEGLDPESPKAAIRDGHKIGLIQNPEEWFMFIETRSLGIHDYFGIPEKDYAAIAKEFLQSVRKIIS